MIQKVTVSFDESKRYRLYDHLADARKALKEREACEVVRLYTYHGVNPDPVYIGYAVLSSYKL